MIYVCKNTQYYNDFCAFVLVICRMKIAIYGDCRTLCKSGILQPKLIIVQTMGLSGNNEKWEKLIEGMHTYKPEEVRLHLTNAGFHDINITQNSEKHWLMVTAVK